MVQDVIDWLPLAHCDLRGAKQLGLSPRGEGQPGNNCLRSRKLFSGEPCIAHVKYSQAGTVFLSQPAGEAQRNLAPGFGGNGQSDPTDGCSVSVYGVSADNANRNIYASEHLLQHGRNLFGRPVWILIEAEQHAVRGTAAD